MKIGLKLTNYDSPKMSLTLSPPLATVLVIRGVFDDMHEYLALRIEV